MKRILTCVISVLVLMTSVTVVRAGTKGSTPDGTFRGDRAETERFLSYYRSIQLSPAQEKIRQEALAALPAPCCKEFSAATCCCECNMARATWGLAKHLIVAKQAGAPQVRAAVAKWHHAINPGGFTGDACSTGGCLRPFAKNGCGGMNEADLIF